MDGKNTLEPLRAVYCKIRGYILLNDDDDDDNNDNDIDI
jgi:hypothetical protein